MDNKINCIVIIVDICIYNYTLPCKMYELMYIVHKDLDKQICYYTIEIFIIINSKLQFAYMETNLSSRILYLLSMRMQYHNVFISFETDFSLI